MLDRAKIIRLAKEGNRPKAIAHALGHHPNTIYDVLRAARRKGDPIPLFSTAKVKETETPVETPVPRQIIVPLRLFSMLQAEADRRGKTTTETAQRLLEDALLGRAVRHG